VKSNKKTPAILVKQLQGMRKVIQNLRGYFGTNSARRSEKISTPVALKGIRQKDLDLQINAPRKAKRLTRDKISSIHATHTKFVGKRV